MVYLGTTAQRSIPVSPIRNIRNPRLKPLQAEETID